jgi:AcrR family transcriptional regulator
MSQTGPERPSVLRAVRERSRAEITRQILDAARRHLATDGASGLSLRAIARELGMSPSAVYRYIPRRDDLLTTLIVAAYDALGAAAEAAEADVARADLAGRWSAVCDAVRAWARARPNEYALLYGTPVPGYSAPSATIAPAARVSGVLLGILADTAALSAAAMTDDDLPPDSRDALAPARTMVPPGVPDVLLQRGLMAWSALFGTVSFELFGHHRHVVGEQSGHRDAFFAECVRQWAIQVGIARERTGPEALAPYANPSPPASSEDTPQAQAGPGRTTHTAKEPIP